MFTKKSKLYLAVITVTLSFLLMSCAFVLSPLPVGIFSSAKFPLDYETGNAENLEYTVLGTANGTAKATSILGLFATGDASISAALNDAMGQYPEADGLIEICIDYQTESLLGLFASMTTIVKGKAIQFQKELTSISSSSMSSEALSKKEPKYSTVSLEDELENWKKEILTYKDLQLKMKWKSFAKRNSIDVPWEEWVKSLPMSEYENYLQSRLRVRKWLGQRLEEGKEADQVAQIDSEEFIKWKNKILQNLTYFYNKQWKSYAKRNSITISLEDWVISLPESEYQRYLSSGKSVDKWLDKKLKE